MALKSLTVIMSAPSVSGALATAFSMTGGDVTVTVNGAPYTITMVKVGDDRSVNDDAGVAYAMYSGNVTIAGLSAWTEYLWTATQGANAANGKFRSATSPKQSATKMTLIFHTCNPLVNVSETGVSAYNFTKHIIDNSPDYPVAAIIHMDDVCYADGFFDGIATQSSKNSQGKYQETATGDNGDRPAYDYAINYGLWVGVIDQFWNNYDLGASIRTPIDCVGLNPYHQYCLENTIRLFSWGDHEFANNMGWSTFAGRVMGIYPNAYHKTGTSSNFVVDGGYDGNGLTVYNQIIKPMQGNSPSDLITRRDTNANHWYLDFGCFRYITPDVTTNADKATSVVLGTSQIDDILDIANTEPRWFTMNGNPAIAMRGMPSFTALTDYYTTYKNENYIAAENDRLWLNTGQNPPSLMENPYTNGELGCLSMARGDWHTGADYFWKAPASAGKAAEAILEIGLDSVSTSVGNTLNLDVMTQTMQDTDNFELLGGVKSQVFSGSPVPYKKEDVFTTLTAEIDGTLDNPQVVFKKWDIAYNAVTGVDQHWAFVNQDGEEITDELGNVWKVATYIKQVRFAGNRGFSVNETPWQLKKTSGDAEV